MHKLSVQLTTEPLNELIERGVSVDFHLDEDRWSVLKKGDVIEFWEDFSGWDKKPTPSARKVNVKIEDILRAQSFSSLIDSLSDEFVVSFSKDEVLDGLRRWWIPQIEKETGVLGIKVRMII